MAIDTELESLLAEGRATLGISQEEIDAPKIEAQRKEQERVAQIRADGIKKMEAANETQQWAEFFGGGLDTATSALAGAARSSRNIVKNTYNGALTALNGLEEVVKNQVPFAQKDIFNPDDFRWTEDSNDKIWQEQYSQDKVAQLSKAVTDIAAPIALTYQAGGLAAVAADAAYNYFASEPEAGNLANVAEGTVFENIPGLTSLMVRPTDSEEDMRLKNALVAAGVTAPFVAIGHMLSKVGQADKHIAEVSKVAEQAAEAPAQAAPKVAAQADNVAPVVNQVDNTPVEGVAPSQVPGGVPPTEPAKPFDVKEEGRKLREQFNSPEQRTLDQRAFDGLDFASFGLENKIDPNAPGSALEASRNEFNLRFIGYDNLTNEIERRVVTNADGTTTRLLRDKNARGYYVSTTNDQGTTLSEIYIEPKVEDGKIVVEISSMRAADSSGRLQIISNTRGGQKYAGKTATANKNSLEFIQENIGDISTRTAMTPAGERTANRMSQRLEQRKAIQEADIVKAYEELAQRRYDAEQAAKTTQVNEVPEAQQSLFDYVKSNTPEEIAKEEQALQEFETAASKVEWFPAQGAKVTMQDGSTTIHPNDPEAHKVFADAIKAADISPDQIYKPLTDEELFELSKAKRANPNFLTNILDKVRQGEYRPDNVEALALREAYANQLDYVAQKAETVNVENIMELAAYVDMTNNLSNTVQGSGSFFGAGLRVFQLAATLDGSSAVEAAKKMGQQGRLKLIQGILKREGGQESVARMVETIKEVNKLGDHLFRRNFMGEVVMRSKYDRITTAVAKVAVNGMVSGFSTFRALTGGIAYAGNLHAQDVVRVLNPKDAYTAAQAWERLYTHFASVGDGFKAGIKAFSEAAQVLDSPMKQTAKPLVLTLEDGTKYDMGSPLEKLVQFTEKGLFVAAADEAPRKYLIAADALVSHIITQGEVAASMAAEVTKRGLVGEEAAKFLANPPKTVMQKAVARGTKFAKDATLQGEVPAQLGSGNTNVPGVILNHLGGILNAGGEVIDMVAPGIGKVFVPFIKVGLNAADQALAHSPLFFASPTWLSRVTSKDPEIASRATAQVATVAAGMLALAVYGRENIRGLGYNKALKEQDAPDESSVRVPFTDQWVSFKGDPFTAHYVNFTAAAFDLAGKIPDDEYSALVTAFAASMEEAMGTENALKTLNIILNPPANEREVNALKRSAAAQPIKFLPMGGALGAIRNTTDPYQRSTAVDDFMGMVRDKYLNRIPGLSDNMPPALNMYAEPLPAPSGIPFASVSPIASYNPEHTRHKEALEMLDKYYESRSDLFNIGSKIDTRLMQNKVDLVALKDFATETLGMTTVRTQVPFHLDPKQHYRLQALAGGIDPSTGKPLEGGTLRKAHEAVLKHFKIITTEGGKTKIKSLNEITPELYNDVATALNEQTLLFKSRAKEKLRQYKDIQEGMNDKYREVESLGGVLNVGK